MNLSTLEAKKQLLSPPGETILETIETLGISQTELCERLGKSKAKTNDLINGKISITNEIARKLEMVLSVSASFWLNLEKEYQEEIVEIEN
jgi:addiction module HigA family antidote